MGDVIWKFDLPTDPIGGPLDVEISMPARTMVLACQVQGGKPCLWGIADRKDITRELVVRTFVIVGTGRAFDSDGLLYVGTYQLDWYVGHVFERR